VRFPVFGSIIRAHRRRRIERAIADLKRATVRDVMSTYIITIRPDETIVAAATKMIAEAISCLVVMDNDRLSGIVTERDFLRKVPFDTRSLRLRVRDVMTADVVTAAPDTPLVTAVRMMREKGFRRVIVTEGPRVVGVVTQNDLMRRAALIAYPVSPELSIGAFMVKDVLTAAPNESFSRARERMRKRGVGCIVIADRGRPLGIFTEYDAVSQFYEQKGRLRVRELEMFMRKHVRALPAVTNAFVAIRFLLEKGIRRIPVADGDRIVGIVTETDLVRFLYLNLDKVLAAAERKDADIRRMPRHVEFHGEFRGDHLKVYGLA